MALFEIPQRANKITDASIAKKAKAQLKQSGATKAPGLLGQMQMIQANVESSLGEYFDKYLVITDEAELRQYIDSCIQNNVISIDTETTGLDPLLDTIAGICVYTPNEKAAYIPINHISYITQQKVPNQLSIDIICNEFNRIIAANIDIIMFNAAFDIRVLRNQAGLKDIYCTWDCYLAARCLNDNEGSGNNNLKALYRKYINNGDGEAFKFESLFKGVPFTQIPIKTGYVYAAHDAYMTYQLYKFQEPYLTPENEKCQRQNLVDVAWVFRHIEMECVSVVCDMEDTGVAFDFDYNDKLQQKYHKSLNEKHEAVYAELNAFGEQIKQYRIKNPTNKLSDPINIDSPTQLAIILYDILGEEQTNGRSTDEKTLKKIGTPLCKAILSYREVGKLINTYIDKLPTCVNKNDGRIHCKYNQYGADTGRFSSSDPNLQNIPSKNHDIRKVFKATDGYVMMSADYSQQEPKVMTQMCQDPKMIKAYQEGKDLYAEIAALSFNTTYDNCLEFRPDGTTNQEGKNRRSQAKSILLGVLYGRGVPSIAEQLGVSTQKAQAIKDSVFKGFPAIPKFEQDSLEMAYDKGYVTTLWGRKRRLPDMQLPEFEFKWKDGVKPDNDVLDFDSEEDSTDEVDEDRVNYYLNKLRYCRFGQKRKVFEEANKEGIWIIDNGEKIAQAQRQCVNARIQGSAADMSKLAMILIGKDKKLKELGFRLLIPVHDELIGECPRENAKECEQRFSRLMSEAAQSRLTIPINCDVEVSDRWYGESIKLC